MFDEAYSLIAQGKIDDAIYSIMDKFDTAYSEGRFDEAAKELLAVDLSRLDDNTMVTVAIVSWWAKRKTNGCHAIVIANVEKKLRETKSKREVKRCLEGLLD